MSDLIALTFDNADEAKRVRDVLKQLQHDGQLSLYDAAVVVKDADGTIHAHNEIDRDVKVGAGVGGLLGVLVGFMFPLAGLAIGAAGGALVGKSLDRDIDKQFVQEVSAALAPGSSALCVLVREGETAVLRAALGPFKGKLYQTTLDPETEQQLRDALKT